MESEDNPEVALSSFAKAAQLCGDLPAPHLRYGEALVERGKIDDAAEQFQFVLNREPTNARALLGMGRIALSRGKLDESRDYLLRSAKAAPGVKATFALLATVEQRLNHSAAADEALARAAQLAEQPEWPDPFLYEANRHRRGKVVAANLADDLLRKGRASEALPLMEAEVQKYPDFPKGWL